MQVIEDSDPTSKAEPLYKKAMKGLMDVIDYKDALLEDKDTIIKHQAAILKQQNINPITGEIDG